MEKDGSTGMFYIGVSVNREEGGQGLISFMLVSRYIRRREVGKFYVGVPVYRGGRSSSSPSSIP